MDGSPLGPPQEGLPHPHTSRSDYRLIGARVMQHIGKKSLEGIHDWPGDAGTICRQKESQALFSPGELLRSSFKVRTAPLGGLSKAWERIFRANVLILQKHFSWKERKCGQDHYCEPKNSTDFFSNITFNIQEASGSCSHFGNQSHAHLNEMPRNDGARRTWFQI